MRLGGHLFAEITGPESWIAALAKKGFTAAYCPVGPDADDATVKAYADAAAEAEVIIAEVGTWSNPISDDPQERQEALDKCINGLALADRIGAKCCVNIAGARGNKWDGPNRANLTRETFDMIVKCTQEILDAVQPTRTYYTLETMPWIFPDSVESYVELIAAIDRPQFAVHWDLVNIINCPARYFDTGAVLREAFAKLGPQMKSCHCKDILLSEKLTVHLDEVRPGLGGVDFHTYLRELDKLDNVPLMIEHLPNEEEYDAAAAHIRSVAAAVGVEIAPPGG
jgi:sugar phosphate isomerase/epimerase